MKGGLALSLHFTLLHLLLRWKEVQCVRAQASRCVFSPHWVPRICLIQAPETAVRANARVNPWSSPERDLKARCCATIWLAPSYTSPCSTFSGSWIFQRVSEAPNLKTLSTPGWKWSIRRRKKSRCVITHTKTDLWLLLTCWICGPARPPADRGEGI